MIILLAADVSIKNIIGGAERVLHEQALYLSEQGHKIFILTRKLPSHSTAYENIDNIQEYRYEVNSTNPIFFLLSTIRNAQKLYKQIALDNKFDVINFHQPFIAFALNILPNIKMIKKVYTCHSLSFEEYISRHRGKRPLSFSLNVLLRKMIERFNLRQADKVIVLSEFTKHKLTSIHGINKDKIEVIPGGVHLSRFQPVLDKKALRTEQNIPQGACILLTVRNLVPRMGLENLIQSVSLLKHKDVDMHLFIVGQGMLKEKLQNLIQELHLESTITLCGFLSDEALLKYYQMADFFILPTIELEGFGLVTIETMACATPVLATPIGGSVEILTPFRHDHLFKDTSSKAMCDLIFEKYAYYKNKPEEYQQLCLQSRKYIEQKYSWEQNAGRFEDCLKTLSGKP